MKKIVSVICLISVLVLAACTSSEEKNHKVAENKDFSVELKDVQYVIVEDDGSFQETDENQFIKVTIDVTNNSDEAMKFYHDMDMSLVDEEDEEFDVVLYNELPTGIDISEFALNPTVKEGESKFFHTLFKVEKDAKYDLHVKVPSVEPVEIPIDLKDYADSMDRIKDPKKALQAYLDLVVFGNENDDEPDLIMVNTDDELEEAYELFAKKMKDIIFYEVEEESIEELFKEYKPYVEEKSTAELTLISNTDSSAIVEVDYGALDHNILLEKLLRMVEDAGSITEEEFVDEVIDTLPTTFESLEIKESSVPTEIVLRKKDEKWYIPSEQMTKKERLLRAYFAGGIH